MMVTQLNVINVFTDELDMVKPEGKPALEVISAQT